MDKEGTQIANSCWREKLLSRKENNTLSHQISFWPMLRSSLFLSLSCWFSAFWGRQPKRPSQQNLPPLGTWRVDLSAIITPPPHPGMSLMPWAVLPQSSTPPPIGTGFCVLAEELPTHPGRKDVTWHTFPPDMTFPDWFPKHTQHRWGVREYHSLPVATVTGTARQLNWSVTLSFLRTVKCRYCGPAWKSTYHTEQFLRENVQLSMYYLSVYLSMSQPSVIYAEFSLN